MHTARRLGPTGAVLLAIVLCVAFAVYHRQLGDVTVYRAGGRAILGGDPYDVRVGAYGFTYPPFAAELFATVAWLPITVLFAGMVSVSALALYVVLRRSAPDVDHSWTVVLRVAPLAMTQPVISNLEWGQVNLVLAALVMHDLLVRRSGVLVGLAAAIKLTPAVFVLYLLLCGRRREARAAIRTFAGAAAFGALLAPAASWRYWTHEAFAGGGVGGFDHLRNQSVRGLAERALGTGLGPVVWLVLAGPLLLAGLLLARRAARAGDEILAAGIVGVTACLVSPVSWLHHWIWCIPCLAAVPLLARLILAALFLNPVQLGHVVGLGYPVFALAAFGLCGLRGRTRGSAVSCLCRSLHRPGVVGIVARTRGAPCP